VSYSGIKTAVINFLEKYKKKDNYTINDIAASFQKRAFTILLKKVSNAVQNYKIERVVVSGGVSANKKLKEIFENGLKNCEVFFPDIKYATDNGAMIAGYGYHLYKENGASPLDEGVIARVVGFKR
jgi:N6-L-threonylcarbamoyladenine synthase